MIKNVAEYLDTTARLFSDKVAFYSENVSITFSTLQEQAWRVGSALTGFGLFRKPVVVATNSKLNAVVSFIAAAYSGNFYVPIDVEMPSARLAKILDILQPTMIITDDKYDGDIYKLLLRAGADQKLIYAFHDLKDSAIDQDAMSLSLIYCQIPL